MNMSLRQEKQLAKSNTFTSVASIRIILGPNYHFSVYEKQQYVIKTHLIYIMYKERKRLWKKPHFKAFHTSALANWAFT